MHKNFCREFVIVLGLEWSIWEVLLFQFHSVTENIVTLQVATVDCRLNLQELEDYLITGLLPQSASSDGHTSGTTVDLDSEGGF